MGRGAKLVGQDSVYLFLTKYIQEHLYAPSIREICEGVGLHSPSTVHSHLFSLERRGLIELGEGNTPRCIKLIGYKLVDENECTTSEEE